MTHALLDRNRRSVIGHRGNAMHAPENTLVSFQQALELGVDAIELDVHLSADGEAVVIHDARVDRTTDGKGVVAAMSLAQLRALDAGARFTPDRRRTYPYRGTGVRIPTLADVLAEFPGAQVVVEIKAAAAQERVLSVIREAHAEDRCIVASFDGRAVDVFRGTGIPIGASRSELVTLFGRACVGMLPARAGFDAAFIGLHQWGLPVPITPFTRAGRILRIPMHVWVENDPHRAVHLWRLGVKGIVTDDPAAIMRAREELLVFA